MSFVQRVIDVTFTLAPILDQQGNVVSQPVFSGTSNTVTLSGLRISASIINAGGASFGSAQIRIYGLTLSMMNQLATLGKPIIFTGRNTVSVSAGDAVSGMALVFEGVIKNAFADFTGAPEVVFTVSAFAGLDGAMKPVPPSSYRGSTDVATIMANLAKQMGYTFENNGVSVILSNPYYPGTARDQAASAATAAHINWIVDKGTLAIWPKGGSRGGLIPLISPETGMVGYPSFMEMGLMIRTLFNPSIQFGANVQVQSSLTPACGIWHVFKLTYDLESLTPGGDWFTELYATEPGNFVIAS